jgi:toxin ParE1/3/4
MKLVVTNSAQADIGDIALYSVEQWGNDTADEYIDGLQAAFELLRKKPDLGRRVSEVRAGLWRKLYREHVIYYRVASDRLFILRVLHKAMLPSRHLGSKR